ncbi:RNA polymerase sigma-70 factor, ECF subfamily [Nocardioides alpinus]|uniref:RNA polymerase sigma-70 factor, ECF subfamily n=1 Tax=Nocardioides alpinus TaxID=748909 RepID=A0A1I0XBB7_9ACTN|nr:sigma-70 family RNA polymerase sigma factor [Nocardioides alpinus]PKH44208.1 SigE family RNA polymerase sigma factor [Nocardioides alpinus]SFA97578.1 RNA polymerase sigma-70 factor, ECF subfamily [Nocardioides alpinus]
MGTPEGREYDWYFRACFPRLTRTVFLMVHDQSLAEDIAQEALYRMLRHWRTVATYDRPEAWARRVAIRIALREIQRRAARPGKERLAHHTPVEHVPDPDVAAAVAGLAPMQRAAVVLFYFDDLPVREIAEVLEVSESTVKQHLHRARHRLAQSLGEEVGEDVR